MSAADLATPKEEIRRAALAAGFDAARFAAPDYGARRAADLAAFLAEGRAGTMDWLAREPERRGDPKALWPEVRSILVLGANYAPASRRISRAGTSIVAHNTKVENFADRRTGCACGAFSE